MTCFHFMKAPIFINSTITPSSYFCDNQDDIMLAQRLWHLLLSLVVITVYSMKHVGYIFKDRGKTLLWLSENLQGTESLGCFAKEESTPTALTDVLPGMRSDTPVGSISDWVWHSMPLTKYCLAMLSWQAPYSHLPPLSLQHLRSPGTWGNSDTSWPRFISTWEAEWASWCCLYHFHPPRSQELISHRTVLAKHVTESCPNTSEAASLCSHVTCEHLTLTPKATCNLVPPYPVPL